MPGADDVRADSYIASIGNTLNRLTSTLSSAGSAVIPGVGIAAQLGEAARGIFSNLVNARTANGDGYTGSPGPGSGNGSTASQEGNNSGSGIIDTLFSGLSSISNSVSSTLTSALSSLANTSVGGALALGGTNLVDEISNPRNGDISLVGLDEQEEARVAEETRSRERAEQERQENERLQVAQNQERQEEERLRTQAQQAHDDQEKQRLTREADAIRVQLTAQTRQLQEGQRLRRLADEADSAGRSEEAQRLRQQSQTIIQGILG